MLPASIAELRWCRLQRKFKLMSSVLLHPPQHRSKGAAHGGALVPDRLAAARWQDQTDADKRVWEGKRNSASDASLSMGVELLGIGTNVVVADECLEPSPAEACQRETDSPDEFGVLFHL